MEHQDQRSRSRIVSSVDLRANIIGPRPTPSKLFEIDFNALDRPDFLRGLPHPDDIPIAREFVTNYRFADLVQKQGFIGSVEIQGVIDAQALKLDIPTYGSGVVPAASNVSNVETSTNILSSYAHHSWHRDAALVALALKNSGHRDKARSVLQSLWKFNASPEQRERFLSYIFKAEDGSYSPKQWFQEGKNIPHIRSKIVGGELVSEPDWGHQQLDAHGLVLWTMFRFANQGIIDLPQEVQALGQHVNPDSTIDSMPSLMIKFLNRIEFWDQKDYGPWEDEKLERRATSIGCCVLALEEARLYFESHSLGYKAIPTGSKTESSDEFKRELEHALGQGTRVLAERIPTDGGLAVECDKYPSDASNILLLYPLSGLPLEQENAILRRIYEQCDGRFLRIHEIGISRRDQDDYVGMDYHRETSRGGLFSDLSKSDYQPAEWTLFDPLLVGYHARNFIDSGGEDLASYHYAQVHLKRMLTHPTSQDVHFELAYDGTKINIPAGIIPEGYFFDTAQQEYLPNHNSPLLMANAAFGLALERMKDAIRLYEIRVRNSTR